MRLPDCPGFPPAVVSAEKSAGDDQRIYLAVEGRPEAKVEPATASWEIAGAIAWASYKVTNSRLLTLDLWRGSHTAPRWFATAPDWFYRWNGQRFEQGACDGGAAVSTPGSELWAWNTSSGELSEIHSPWQQDCR